MKADIITLHYINHYGSLLQTYATTRMFEKMGFEAEIIDYIRPNAQEKELIRAGLESKGYGKNVLKKAGFVISKKIENKKRKEFSERFLKKNVRMTRLFVDYYDLKKNPPEADVYVTGSDQTWNSDYNGGILPAYYLDFAPEGKKRIGYSVSIGMPEIPAAEQEQTREYVMKYSAISVRENTAKQLLETLGYKNVTHILDPTLVLNRDDWMPMVAKRMIKGKYIIIYKLNPSPELEEFAVKLAEETGCQIVRMSYYLNHLKLRGKMIYSPEVEEFLSLIYHADYVLTDSFHCLAFSINFGKEFFAFYPGKYSTRLRSLLELTNTTDRVITDTSKYNLAPIDYEYVNMVLIKEREKAAEFIRKNCIEG